MHHGSEIPVFEDFAKTHTAVWYAEATPRDLEWTLDYTVYQATGDLLAARKAAVSSFAKVHRNNSCVKKALDGLGL